MGATRTLAAAAAAALVLSGGLAGSAGSAGASFDQDEELVMTVLGDLPYTDAQYEAFPRLIDQVNADPDVSLVVHLGDIKSGSTRCDDGYLGSIRAQFDRVEDPLVYTPGDNEWTDCHRANNGGYDPLERLAKVRETFFPHAGRTLGRAAMQVSSQDRIGFPENVLFERAGAVFAALHVVGSNNGLAPWTGSTASTPAQADEEERRTAAALRLLDHAFARAETNDESAVVLLMQADMFDPTVASPAFAQWSAFQVIVHAIAGHAADFGGPVYLIDGDSHVFNVDRPLAPGSPWAAFYGVADPAPNLTRITVSGAADAADWLKVRVGGGQDEPLEWERVPIER